MVTAGDSLKCPCGCGQQLAGDAAGVFARITAGQPATVVVAIPAGVYQVPRLFIAIHGLAAQELPTLADRFGWAVRG